MEFYSLRNNDKKHTSNQKDILNIKELILKLDIMFEEKLSKAFKDIMNIPRNEFLNIIISEVKNFIDEQYGDDIYKNEKFINFFSSSCNNLKDKYKTYFEELTKTWEDYQSNTDPNSEYSFYFTNFRKHCIKTDNFAMHKCSESKKGIFISQIRKNKRDTINIKNKNIQNNNLQYLICNKCKSVYFSNKFINYCKDCNQSYLCSSLSHNEDPNLLLATWVKPHCETLVNEKIKCSKCKENFLYLNLKLNRLQCHNKGCTFNEVPHNLEWSCYVCNKVFCSNVKVYNPVEVQQIKDIIKLTLLIRKKAHPSRVTCCKNLNVLSEDFYHKRECKGLLYFGEYKKRIIIVCDKCKAINFESKFIWTCPQCESRFKDKGSVNKDECYKKILSPSHDNSRYTSNINYNMLNESENKGRKDSYNNLNNTLKNNENNNTNNKGHRKIKETLFSILKRKNEKSENDINIKNINTNDTNIENNNINININKSNSMIKKENSCNIINISKILE